MGRCLFISLFLFVFVFVLVFELVFELLFESVLFEDRLWYFQVRVLVHTPAHLAGREKNAGLVYAHGGAVLSGSAHLYKPHLSLLAINCGIPVFNVDYRQKLFCTPNPKL